jgi:hypothetical protein
MKWQQIGDTWARLKDRAESAWDRSASGLGRTAAGKGEELAEGLRERYDDVRDQIEGALDAWSPRAFGRRAAGPPPALAVLAGAGLGAGLMYFLDPQQGRRRRALVRDQFVHALHEIDDAVGVLSRDLGNRSRGAWSGLRSLPGRLTGEAVPDDVLLGRVRAKLGRYVSHPRSIEVDVSGGRISLTGPTLAHEVDDLLEAVASVPGVTEVENRLEVHDRPGDVPGLQGGRGRVGERAELWQSNWSPTARLLVGAAGGALLMTGAGRRGLAGLALGGLGAGLLARAVTNIPFQDWTGALSGVRVADLPPVRATRPGAETAAGRAPGP